MTATPGFENASSGLMNSANSVESVVLMTVMAVVAAAFVAAILSNYERFAWLADKLRLVRLSLGYAGYGLATVVVLSIPVALVWAITRAQRATQGEFAKWVGLAFVGYVILVGVGYLARPVWKRGHDYATRYYETEMVSDDG